MGLSEDRMPTIRQRLTYQGIPLWRHAEIIQWTTQILSGIAVVVLVTWFFFNIVNAVQDREIPHGFSFLSRSYQTPIGHHFLPYEASDSYLYALVVAITNTVVVAIAGVILATILGIFIGVARLSDNWLVSRLAAVYVEFFRNVPLLLLLFFWFYIWLALPQAGDSYGIERYLYLDVRGMAIPFPLGTSLEGALIWVALAVLGVAAGIFTHRLLTRREVETGKASYPIVSGWAAIFIIGAVGWLVVGAISGEAPFAISTPLQEGQFFEVVGGFFAPAGLLVLLIALVMYTASYIAEIVRAGITSVSRGQTEAASALGLSPLGVLRHVTFPQALRVIIPPLISQFLNLTKNSSLAAAIGYSDLTNVAKTMTQIAPAVSIFILIMLAYLAMSLTWSVIGNLYNRKIRFSGG